MLRRLYLLFLGSYHEKILEKYVKDAGIIGLYIRKHIYNTICNLANISQDFMTSLKNDDLLSVNK